MQQEIGVEKQLQVLILEDDAVDALRLTHELSRQGVAFQSTRVQTQEAFVRAMEENPPDLILSDHGLPSFSGFVALNIVQERCPEVPFIFVTGSSDQAMMVEMFESGAAGYVNKNHLSDLVPAVRQVLREAKTQTLSPPDAPSETQSETPPEIRPFSRGKPAEPTSAPAAESKATPEQLWVCSECNRVLNDQGVWERLKVYLRRHERATVTLGLCPDCASGNDRDPSR